MRIVSFPGCLLFFFLMRVIPNQTSPVNVHISRYHGWWERRFHYDNTIDSTQRCLLLRGETIEAVILPNLTKDYEL